MLDTKDKSPGLYLWLFSVLSLTLLIRRARSASTSLPQESASQNELPLEKSPPPMQALMSECTH